MNGITGSPPPASSPLVAQWLIFGVAALLLGGIMIWGAYQEYDHVMTVERERMLARAKVVDENMARQLDSIDRMLTGMRTEWRRWETLPDGMFRASRRMAAMVNIMPGVRLIAVLDRQGRIIASSHDVYLGQDYSHREYFQAAMNAATDADRLYISSPFRNASGINTLSLSRAIAAPDGKPGGIVMASLEPEEFRTLMNSVRHAPDIRVSLVHGDGKVFMTLPEREGLAGMDLAARPDSFFNRHIASGKIVSIMEGAIPAPRAKRMMVMRTLQPAVQHMSKPLIIAISRDPQAVFARWRQEAWMMGGFFGLLLAASGAGLFAYQRRQRNFERIIASHEAEQGKTAERLRLATESAGIGIWEYDIVSGKQYWDDTMLALYGITREQFTADYAAWWGRLLPEDMAMIEAAVEATLERGEPYDLCFRIRRGDGEVRTLHALGRLIFDPSGKPLRMIGVNEDVTRRIQTEQALAESEGRFREIFDAVGEAIFIHDAETGRIIDVNRRMLEMYEIAREQAHACSMDDLSAGAPPYSAAEAIEKIRLARAGEPQIFEWLARTRKGRYFWAEVSLRLANIGGVPRILAVVRDISDRKHMDAELRIAAIAFESQDGMLVTDDHSVILRVNHAFTEITGYTAEEAAGQTPRMLKSGRHDAAFYAGMWESIRHRGSWHGEVWNRRKNGEIYPEQLTITAVKSEKGETTHYVATLRDITERKAAEKEIHTLAFYDALTGLPNRRLLDDRLKRVMAASKRSGLYGALMFLDLDNFKPLNDTHGHDVGDLLLVEAARRISSCVREADTVARFGGDEFVVVLGELEENRADSGAQAAIVAEKIRAILEKPYTLKFSRENKAETTVEHLCTASIGAALFINHEASPEDILKWADIAMYQAKEGGRNRTHFYGS